MNILIELLLGMIVSAIGLALMFASFLITIFLVGLICYGIFYLSVWIYGEIISRIKK